MRGTDFRSPTLDKLSMHSLLVQSCSATKNRVTEPTRALDVYDGYFFRIIKKAIRDGEFNSDVDICILSAEHGLIDADDTITTYDRRMTPSRAEELRESVTNGICKRVDEEDYNKVVLNLGKEYFQAVGDLTEQKNVETSTIHGGGIGVKGRKLKRFVRTDSVSAVIS